MGVLVIVGVFVLTLVAVCEGVKVNVTVGVLVMVGVFVFTFVAVWEGVKVKVEVGVDVGVQPTDPV